MKQAQLSALLQELLACRTNRNGSSGSATTRAEVSMYPEKAIRELVANALIHRINAHPR